ncbi:MAG: hypothetical protein ACXW32_09925, partial [Limisphaerales bacterium]
MIDASQILSENLDGQHEAAGRRRLEEKVSLLQQFNELLIDSSGDCILVVDADGVVLSTNKTGRD